MIQTVTSIFRQTKILKHYLDDTFTILDRVHPFTMKTRNGNKIAFLNMLVSIAVITVEPSVKYSFV